MWKFSKTLRLAACCAALTLCTLASAAALETAQTTASQLNLRTEPYGPVITTIPEGTTLAILATDGEWSQVSVNGLLGYVSNEYLTQGAAESDFAVGTGVINADDVNFRTEPNTSSEIRSRFQSGTSVSVIGVSDGWFKIQYNGLTGYVHPDYLTVQNETPVAVPLSNVNLFGMNPTRQAVLEFAAQYLGTPYKYGGSTPDGFDCSGFTYYVFKNVVQEIPRTATDQSNAFPKLTIDELLPGDLVFFRNQGSGVGHAGIYVGEGQFIHSPNSGDYVSYDTLLTGNYNEKFICGGRVIVD